MLAGSMAACLFSISALAETYTIIFLAQNRKVIILYF